MKRLFTGMLAAMALMGLAACSTPTGGTSSGTQAVMKATQVALTTYADVFQPAVLAYGHLAVCPKPTPSGSICRDNDVLRKMQAADLAVTSTLSAAQPVLNGSLPDGGQLADALSAIQTAEAVIAGSGALKLNK